MGFLDALRGRITPKVANLDSLFLVPSAGITLETSMGLRPKGEGSVCYRAAEGAAFAETQTDIVELLDNDGDDPAIETTKDEFGFTWLVVKRPDLSELCTDLHAVNTSLEAQGFGPSLLCSIVPFADASGREVGLVYLYKQGAFYPFAPIDGKKRDNLLEIQIRDQLAAELPMEPDLQRWLALWGAPGLNDR